MRFIYLFIAFSFLVAGCFYDNEQDLFQLDDECETTEVSYSEDVVLILERRCLRCHSAGNPLGAGVNLDGFDFVRERADIGSLVGTLRGDGFPSMPTDTPPIPDCEIDMITSWVADGALNN